MHQIVFALGPHGRAIELGDFTIHVVAANDSGFADIDHGRNTQTYPKALKVRSPRQLTDPNFASVKLLVGANGTNGATTTSDESGAAHGAGAFTNATLDTSQFKFGVSSIGLNTSFNAVQWATSADWNFGSGNFTVECWARTTTVASSGFNMLLANWNAVGSISFFLARAGATLAWHTSTTGSDNNADITTGSLLSINTWYAIALDFDGSKYRLYLDGTMVGSFSTPRTLFNSAAKLSIGGDGAITPGSYWIGWIDEVRITKGVARYASDGGYTVVTSEFPRS